MYLAPRQNDYEKRTPTWIHNLVLPRLNASEQACINFLLFHAFADPEKPNNPVDFDFFINGSGSEDIVFCLGTGLSKNTTRTSLNELETLGLIKRLTKCKPHVKKTGIQGCGWKGEYTDKCPECDNKSLTDCFCLRTITPGLITRFLKKTDVTNREWNYNPELEFFFATESHQKPIEKDLKLEIEENVSKVQHKDFLEQLVNQAVQHNKSNKLADNRYLKGFVMPMLQLQEEFPAQAVKYALQRTVAKKAASSSNPRKTWLPYARACAKGYLEKNHGGHKQVGQAIGREKISTLLAQCAELNYEGKNQKANAILFNIEKNFLEQIAQMLDADLQTAQEHVRVAFQKGIDDFEDPFFYTTGNEFSISAP